MGKLEITGKWRPQHREKNQRWRLLAPKGKAAFTDRRAGSEHQGETVGAAPVPQEAGGVSAAETVGGCAQKPGPQHTHTGSSWRRKSAQCQPIEGFNPLLAQESSDYLRWSHGAIRRQLLFRVPSAALCFVTCHGIQ